MNRSVVGWCFTMTGHIRTTRPARAAIAAVLALSATPLLAQEIAPAAEPAPATAPAPMVTSDGNAALDQPAGDAAGRRHAGHDRHAGLPAQRARGAADRPGRPAHRRSARRCRSRAGQHSSAAARCRAPRRGDGSGELPCRSASPGCRQVRFARRHPRGGSAARTRSSADRRATGCARHPGGCFANRRPRAHAVGAHRPGPALGHGGWGLVAAWPGWRGDDASPSPA